MLASMRWAFSCHTGKRVADALTKMMSTTDRDAVDFTVQALAKDLQRHNIDYAIVGGNALKVHGFWRFTTDVDVLLCKGGRELFALHLVGRGYTPRYENSKSKFKNSVFNVNIDLLESGGYPGDGKPKGVTFPDPESHSFEVISPSGILVRYLELSSIIEMKLASYQSLPNDRERDKLDVVDLIKAGNLGASFADKLDSSVRNLYTECYNRAVKELMQERVPSD